jgi:hypothetical protein
LIATARLTTPDGQEVRVRILIKGNVAQQFFADNGLWRAVDPDKCETLRLTSAIHCFVNCLNEKEDSIQMKQMIVMAILSALLMPGVRVGAKRTTAHTEIKFVAFR